MNVPGKLCQADGLTAAGHGDILRMKLCNWKKKRRNYVRRKSCLSAFEINNKEVEMFWKMKLIHKSFWWHFKTLRNEVLLELSATAMKINFSTWTINCAKIIPKKICQVNKFPRFFPVPRSPTLIFSSNTFPYFQLFFLLTVRQSLSAKIIWESLQIFTLFADHGKAKREWKPAWNNLKRKYKNKKRQRRQEKLKSLSNIDLSINKNSHQFRSCGKVKNFGDWRWRVYKKRTTYQ